MAKANQIKALIESHQEGDDERFLRIASQIAANATRNGHKKLAADLLDLLKSNEGPKGNSKPTPMAQPKGELGSLLDAKYPTTKLEHLVLSERLVEQLKTVVHEQRQRSFLLTHGFAPTKKLLFVGPPGTGKTMNAKALANALSIPLFTVRLDGLITKFMGEAAAKLRLIFDSLQLVRGVYFFDEFDAIGGARDASNDVGEARRTLNSLLQFIEDDDSDSLIVAATNHKSLLDKALFRRFDLVADFELPGVDILQQLMKNRLCASDCAPLDWQKLAQSAAGLSHSEIVKACEAAARKTLLNGSKVTNKVLDEAIRDRQRM